MILDIGCGTRPAGHVNVDLYPGQTIHRDERLGSIDTKQVPNFVRADIHRLPFRDKIFTESYCTALLEHEGICFATALKELVRVAETTCFSVPHRSARNGLTGLPCRIPGHDKFFSVRSIEQYLKKYYPVYQITTEYKPYPHVLLPLVKLPFNIKVMIRD